MLHPSVSLADDPLANTDWAPLAAGSLDGLGARAADRYGYPQYTSRRRAPEDPCPARSAWRRAQLGLESRVQLASWVAGHDLGPATPAHG
jgi:hypothetical protein